jgi:dimethylargininase
VTQNRALVRRPSPRLAEGLLTHIERSPVDAELAGRQWTGYVTVLDENGWEIIEVPPAEDCPDSAFVEDTMVVYGDLAVISRPGAEQRRPETAAAEATVATAGYRTAHITEPGTLDGGDVLKIVDRVYCGVGGRTNDLGVAQLREHLGPLGAEVIAVPVTKVLHLKSAVTALPDGTVIGYEPLVDDPGAFESFLAVPEDTGSHVVVLDEETVLMASSATKTVELLADRGLKVLAVDISEFERLEGCVTCLSVRLRS